MINWRGFLSSFAGAAGAMSALGFPPRWAPRSGVLVHKDVDRFLGAFDEYKKGKAAA